MIAAELGASGHQVEIACNGLEALMSLESSPPDAIVLDLMMPKLNGWDFVMESVGVKRFLPKPFAIDMLERCITEVTAG